MKLTDAQAFCLAYLANHGDSEWLPLLRAASGLTRDDVSDSLDDLVAHGLAVSVRWAEGFKFRITDTGRQALRDHREGEG